jgi:hypothetical protein
MGIVGAALTFHQLSQAQRRNTVSIIPQPLYRSLEFSPTIRHILSIGQSLALSYSHSSDSLRLASTVDLTELKTALAADVFRGEPEGAWF